MKEFKVKIELGLNGGKVGISLDRLANISEEINKFFIDLGEDCAINPEENKWVATNFHNSNLNFDVKNDIQEENKHITLRDYFTLIVTDKSGYTDKYIVNKINPRTYFQYTKIADKIEVGEKVSFTLYDEGNRENINISGEMTKDKAIRISEVIQSKEFVEYYGNVYGVLHSWQKESDPPYVKIRDLIGRDLINCYYSNNKYSYIYDLFEDRVAIVYVSGNIKANRFQRKIIEITAEKFVRAPEYRDGDLDRFIGCSPGLIGDMSSGEYVDRMYRDE